MKYSEIHSIIQKRKYSIYNIKSEKYENNLYNFGISLLPIVYSPNDQIFYCESLINDIIVEAKKYSEMSIDKLLPIFETLIWAMYRSKYFGFEAEKEVKIIILIPENSSDYVLYNDSGNPYIRLVFDEPIPVSMLTVKNGSDLQKIKNDKEFINSVKIDRIVSSPLYNISLRKK